MSAWEVVIRRSGQPDRVEPLLEHLDGRLITEDAELEALPWQVLTVQGQGVTALLGTEAGAAHITVGDAAAVAVRCSHTGAPGYDLLTTDGPALVAALTAACSSSRVASDMALCLSGRLMVTRAMGPVTS